MSFYKKIKQQENKKTFLFGMLFSYKKKKSNGYVDRRLFGLWKAKKKNHTIRYYICGLYLWKKSTEIEDAIKAYETKIKSLEIKIADTVSAHEKDIRSFITDTINVREKNLNKNFVTLFFENSNDYHLLYTQTDASLFIFSKDFFQYDCDFVYNYICTALAYSASVPFKIMSPDCALYKEHIDKFKSGNVLCCKYMWRYGLVCRSVITKNPEKQDIYLEADYLGLENYHTDDGRNFINIPRQKIVKGITLHDYLLYKTDEEQKKILKDFFDWLFETYQYPDDNDKLDGRMADCNLYNFLVYDGTFIPIDMEFEMKGGLPKNVCMHYALGRKEIRSPHYEPHPFWGNDNRNLAKAAVLNRDLKEKYFTEKYLIPEYKTNI